MESTTIITLNVEPDFFISMIEGGNKDHPESKDLTLQAKIIG